MLLCLLLNSGTKINYYEYTVNFFSHRIIKIRKSKDVPPEITL